MSDMQIGAHSTNKDPNVLLLPDPERQVTWLHDKYLPIFGAIIGYGGSCFRNYFHDMPLHAGIWRHILLTAVLVPAGYYWNIYRERKMGEYDALLHWYITQHPEEFPVPERHKLRDMMKPWLPMR
ncbi:unnamed protein product [Bemisia tabaci]|uniref:NADH dehydrogenase [ubiquinone] 1 subunit C2 n=1 Tax=Bemisia tabaci TaxID=7038 RepID=A0A9P0F487_BEMTA|nr:unnamed protein product [Bemisia tabaci]